MNTTFWRALLPGLLLLSSPWHHVSLGQGTKRPALLLVTNEGDATVSVFNGATLKLTATVPVGESPGELCVAPDGNRGYILNRLGNSVSVIDLEALKVTATVSHPKLLRPAGCAVGRDSKKVYVVSPTQHVLLIVSAETNQVVKEIPVSKTPLRVAASPDGRTVYVSSDGTGHVQVVDTSTEAIVATIKAGNSSRNMTFTPDGKALLVIHTLQDTVSVIDTATHEVLTTFGVGTAPQEVAVTSDGELAFVLARGNTHMNVIWMGGKDSRKSIRSVDLLPWPIDMVATDRNLFVVHDRDDTMSVVRVRTLETMEYSTARTGKSPFAIAIRP